MSMPGLRRAKAHRWFEEKVKWPMLDARDWVLRRDSSKPLYETHRPRMRTRAKWALLDAWDANRPATRMRNYMHQHRGGVLAFVALPVAVAAAIVGVTLGSGGGQTNDAPVAHANNAPPPRVEVKGAAASSEDQQAKADAEAARERAAKRRERAAEQRRERAADRRRARAELKRERAADRKRAAARRARARRAARRAPARPSPPPTVVSSPSPPPRPSAPAPAPVRPQAPSRPPSRPAPQPQPSPGVQFDDAG
jgi:hypothetical protein